MPATRLLLIADSKILPALANGLRESAQFDVQTAAISDPAAAQAAAESAEAVALFYGAPGATLAAALQSLSPKVRQRGGRVVAVLQRDQAAQRDDCFRAGASDLLFMPMPRDQFVARLQAALGLSFAGEGGVPAPVSVATRASTSRVEKATVSRAGVEAAAELPLKAGETVRLQWSGFQAWGLVVRGAPSAQIRFAGLGPDEELQIRSWLNGGEKSAPASPARAAVDTGAASLPPPEAAARAAPAAGPPPGFAERKAVRPPARAPARTTPPRITPVAPSAPAAPAAEARPVAAAVHPGAANGAALTSLFDEGAAPAPPAAEAAAAPGPSWPEPMPLSVCKSAALQFLVDKTLPPDTPPAVAASAKKISGNLGPAERGALAGGAESPFADALAARIALDLAAAEGARLSSRSPAPVVDAAAVAALTRQVDEVAARLQKEANAAVGKGQLEILQTTSAASAALSRDLLAFRQVADRLRGLGSAPHPGAGSLDPEMAVPGQAPRPKAQAAGVTAGPAPVRAELRDFKNLDARPGRGKQLLMLALLAALAAALANAFYFSVPRHAEISPETAGREVERIDVSGAAALVTIKPEWLSIGEAGVPPLIAALKDSGAKKAILILPNGVTAGVVDLQTGKVSGLMRPKGAPPK